MTNGKKLEYYWCKVFKNSNFASLLTPKDEEILSSVVSVSSNITTDTLELCFTMEDSENTTAGTYTRRLVLDNGQPIEFVGDDLNLKKT